MADSSVAAWGVVGGFGGRGWSNWGWGMVQGYRYTIMTGTS